MCDLNSSPTRHRPNERRVSASRNPFIAIAFLGVIIAALPQSGCLSLSGSLAGSQSSLSFGNVAIGSISKQNLTLKNSGAAAITVTKAVASGGGFTVTGPPLPLTLAVGQSAIFIARFAPPAVGNASGRLLITRTQVTVPQLAGGSGSAAPSITTSLETITMTGEGVSQAPAITTQPTSQTVTTGQTATFSVTSLGAAPLSYQWSKNGAAITGATSASYTTPATATSDSGSQLTVVVSNSAGNVTSNAAILTVTAEAVAPSITTQPTNQTVTTGQPATFSVTSWGPAPLNYQWRKNGAGIRGATSASYIIPATATSDSGSQFSVVVSNSTGSVTSNAATLTVTTAAAAPSITTQPVSQTVVASQTATFQVTASGTAPLSYQWSKNGAAIPGATSMNYTTPAAATSDSGSRFMVAVSNSVGNVTSNDATLTVTAADVAPSIITQPANQMVTVGQTGTFSVTASGTSPLNYQWRKNGTTINGATSPSYTTPATAISDSGSAFSVAISNSKGSVTSNTATLTVNAPLVAIAVTPNNATVLVRSTQQFSANVTGTSNTSVTWSVSGVGCTGAACGMISASGLYTSPLSVPSPATVTVKATSVADPTKSASASVTIAAALAVLISISPTSASVPTSGMQLFTASVTGTSNTAVTWGLSGAGCSGSSCGSLSTSGLSAVYSAPSLAPSPASVSVVATSVADPTKSASAKPTIVPSVFVSVTPATVSVPPGIAQQFSATVTGTSNTAVGWVVSGAGCSGAACGTIDSSGRYTAPATVSSPPIVTVTATSVADPTKSGSANLTFSSVNPPVSLNVNALNIPASHPRLFWNAARMAKAKTWWAKNSYTPNYTNPNPFDSYDTLFACLMSNNSTWCNAQINWAVTLDESSCYQAVGCDSMRGSGESVMLTYDWLYAMITPAQRTAIINNWNTWQTYLDTQNSWGNTGMPSSNYFAGAFRTDFSAGVATQGDNSSATAFLNYGLNSRWAALVNFNSPTGTGPLGAKGYALHSQEGSQYGRYSLAYYAIPLTSSALLGRDMWQETTAFKAGVLQTIYNTMPTQTVSRGLYDGWTWSDDENWVSGAGLYGGGGMQSRYYGDFMMAASQEFPTTAIGQLARQWINTVKPTIGPMWLAVDSGGATQPFSTLPLDYYASGPQYVYWRNSWNADASSLLLQMGETLGIGHTHFDVGAFQWFRSGSYLIRETPTYGNTLAGYNSVGTVGGDSGFAHNVPLIGGLAEVTAGCRDSDAVVRRLESQSTYAYIDADISGTYTNNVCAGNHPERENAAAQHVEREFIFFRDIEVLLILDRLQADTATRGKTFTSHCETSPVSINASHYTCVDGGQKASYSVLLPATPSLVVVNEAANGATCEKGTCQYRLEVNDNTPIGAQSYFMVAIQGLGVSGTGMTPAVQDNGASWTITLDANHSAVLNKGMSSAGGTVTINGTTTNLRADAQSMTITDSGPVW
jgi:hypothetical protein